MSRYLFNSERLGFRKWQDDDLKNLIALNSDPEVMRYFPSILDKQESYNLLIRLKDQYWNNGYTYYAVEELEAQQFIGFIGLAWQDFESLWTPFTDIGWRLKKEYWGKGLATEGAQRCLEYGFQELRLEKIYAVASKINIPSIRVMEKIGMSKIGEFVHPKLVDYAELKECVVYRASEFRRA